MINDVLSVILAIIIGCVIVNIFNNVILPFIINKRTKDIEKNPEWITSRVQNKYYGFSDIDFIIVDSPLGRIPRFRLSKDRKRLELLISDDTKVDDIEAIAKVALMGKIQVRYGLSFQDKPIHWLSILCYMLDGGDIVSEDHKPKVEERQETN